MVADGDALLAILAALGLHVWFRYEKYREEFAADGRGDRHRRDAGRHVRRDRRRRGRHPRHGARARAARPPTTSSTRIARCSCSIATPTAWPDTTWCSPAVRRARVTICHRPALVLTAGLGTRLRPLSSVRAKAALPVAGDAAGPPHPALARRRRRHAAWSLNLHHRADHDHARARRRRRPGLDVRYSWEPEVLGSAGGPRRALAAARRRSLPDRQRRHADRRRPARARRRSTSTPARS